MKKTFTLLLIAGFVCLLTSCEKQEEMTVTPIFKEKISGYAQKGPFISGTSITIAELNNRMGQTGKMFDTQITNNEGCFELNNVELSSPYVELKATGFYFNEVSGKTSNAQLTLNAIADLQDAATLNVNILSHLEKPRITYLMSLGNDFASAKTQAQKEVLAIFGITKEIPQAETLDITKTGDGNAILLAVSLMAQGFRTEAELSELLANICTDIREDGKLDNTTLGSKLLNDARLLNLAQVRANLEARYQALGVTVTIPEFESYITDFVANSPYTITNNIIYPEMGRYGTNALFGDATTIKVGTYSLAADLPKGTSLKIVVTSERVAFSFFPDVPINFTLSGSTLTSVESGQQCDIKIEVRPAYSFFDYQNKNITIEIYENGATTPTRTKIIEIEEVR